MSDKTDYLNKENKMKVLFSVVKVVIGVAIGFLILMGAYSYTTADRGKSADEATENELEKIAENFLKPYYSLKDGYEYGYEKVLSDADVKAGKVASTLIMFKYAGKKDNTYQVFNTDQSVYTVFQCKEPCEFIQIMTFDDSRILSKETMRAVYGSVAQVVMDDARNGMLEQYVGEATGVKVNVWFDESKGVIATPVNEIKKNI